MIVPVKGCDSSTYFFSVVPILRKQNYSVTRPKPFGMFQILLVEISVPIV